MNDVIARLGSLLRTEGFTNICTLRSGDDVSLSAAKGGMRLVTHISYHVPVPSPTRPHDAVPGPAGRAAQFRW